MIWYIWLILAGLFLIIEIFTLGFLVFWLSIGALLTMFVSFFTKNLIIQMSVFVVSSTILIFATKPFVKKFTENSQQIKTNVYYLIGKIGIVTKEINPIHSTGQIKVNGELWSAISKDEQTIPKGTEIEILEVNGVKVIVAPANKTSK